MRSLLKDMKASAISFVIGIFILILIAVNLLPEVAEQAWAAENDTDVAHFAGVGAMLGILVLLFVVIPLIVIAKAAR